MSITLSGNAPVPSHIAALEPPALDPLVFAFAQLPTATEHIQTTK